MSLAGDSSSGEGGARSRGRQGRLAQRVLNMVFLSLRSETMRASASDEARAEALADRIVREFPGRILPIGLCALAVLVVVCSAPLVRDALPSAGILAESSSVTTVVESGLRRRGAEMSDGIEALRAIVAPFADDSGPLTAPRDGGLGPSPDADASAPFVKS